MVPSSSVAFSLEISAQALLSLGDFGQELGLDLGRIIDTGRHAVGEQLDQSGPSPFRRILQQADQFLGLLRSAAAGEYQALHARQRGHDRIPARRRPFSYSSAPLLLE
jgi:chorismate-pyruvate lyase